MPAQHDLSPWPRRWFAIEGGGCQGWAGGRQVWQEAGWARRWGGRHPLAHAHAWSAPRALALPAPLALASPLHLPLPPLLTETHDHDHQLQTVGGHHWEREGVWLPAAQKGWELKAVCCCVATALGCGWQFLQGQQSDTEARSGELTPTDYIIYITHYIYIIHLGSGWEGWERVGWREVKSGWGH